MLEYKIIKKITDGMSKDQKYIVKLLNYPKNYLLRISDFSDKKINNYMVVKDIYSGLSVGSLFTYFIKEDKIYAFFEYIEGKPLKRIISELSKNEKYNFGLQAGKLLNCIHNRYNQNIVKDISNKDMIEYILNLYKNCNYKNEIIDELYELSLKYVDLIDLSEYKFLNSDFHWMNMIIQNKKLYLIDFEKYEYGNKCRDFTFIYTCNEDRIFSKGLIDGYFNSKSIPDNFWINFKFFSLLSIIQYYMWNISKFNKLNDSITIAKKIKKEFAHNEFIPNWFFCSGGKEDEK